MNPTPQESSLQEDDPNFYDNGEDAINNHISNLKKSITIKRNLCCEFNISTCKNKLVAVPVQGQIQDVVFKTFLTLLSA